MNTMAFIAHRFFIASIAMMMVTKLTDVTADEIINEHGPAGVDKPSSPVSRSYPKAVSELWELVKSKSGQDKAANQDATKCPFTKPNLSLELGHKGEFSETSQFLYRNLQLVPLFEKLLRSEKMKEPNKSCRGQNLYSILRGNNRANSQPIKAIENSGKNYAGNNDDKQVLCYNYDGTGVSGKSRNGAGYVATPEVEKAAANRVKRVRDIDDEYRRLLWIWEERRRAMEVRRFLEQIIQWKKRQVSPQIIKYNV